MEILAWRTPKSVYYNEIKFSQKQKNLFETDIDSVNKTGINCGTQHQLKDADSSIKDHLWNSEMDNSKRDFL